MSHHELRGSQPHPRGTGRNPATGTSRTGPHQPMVTTRVNSGEAILHQVPVLLGGGRSFFQEVPAHVRLRLLDVVAAPGVTHLHYEVIR
jgi:hypothetical protein